MADSVKNIKANIFVDDKNGKETLRGLTAQSRKLNGQLRNLDVNSEAYQRKVRELRKVRGRIREHSQAIYGVNRRWKSVVDGFNRYSNIAIAGIAAITGAAFGLQQTLQSMADLSDLRADVQKTTGLTKKEIDELQAEFDSLNTRTSRRELLGLAAQAGKMGVKGVHDIGEFVEQVNELNVALGDDLGDDAALQMGKMADIFDTSIRKIGSGINAVSDSTKANAGFLTEFTARMAGISKETGIAAGDVVGFGASLDEMGLKVEMSSTALNAFFTDFVKDTEKFGQAAGFANGELGELIGEKGTNEGFLAFLERLRETTNGSDEFLRKLDEVGISGARKSQTFLALSQNIDKLRQNQALANEEIAKGTSLTEEYNRKNENFAAKWERITRIIRSQFMSSGFLDFLKSAADRTLDWIEQPLSEKLQEDRIELNQMALELNNVNTTTDERVALIQKLQDKYPDYLGNLDAEKASNEDLQSAIKKVNDELLNKIMLQAKQEEITEATEDLGDAEARRIDNLRRIQELMIEINGETFDPSQYETNEELIEAAKEQVKSTQSFGAQGVGASGFSSSASVEVTRLQAVISDYAGTLKQVESAEADLMQVQEERQFLQEQLGTTLNDLIGGQDNAIDAGDAAPAGGNNSGGPGGQNGAAGDAQIAARRRVQKQIEDILNEGKRSEEEIIRQKYQNLIAKAEQYGLDTTQLTKAMNNEIIDAVQEQKLKEWEEEDKKNAELRRKAEEHARKRQEILVKYGLAEQKSKYEQELEMLKSFYENDLINYKEYIAAKKQVENQHEEEVKQQRTSNVQSHLYAARQIANYFGSMLNAMKQQELSKIEEVTRRQGESEEDFTKRKEEAEKKRQEIHKKYAVKEALTQVAQIGIETALSIMKAYSQLGPIAGTVAAVALGATGAAQAATAMNQANQIKSYAIGGYTGLGRGTPDPELPGRNITGYVHDNEYVVPSELLSRPDVGGMVEDIEQVRQGRLRGFATGGFTGPAGGTTVVNNTTNNTQSVSMDRLEKVLTNLERRMAQPSVAVVPDRTRQDLNEQNKLEQIVRQESFRS